MTTPTGPALPKLIRKNYWLKFEIVSTLLRNQLPPPN